MVPLFSIITITRNHRDGLIRTYQSVQAQTYRDFEWIVIDGASTDGTVSDLAHMKPALAISEPDTGIYHAMNKGLGPAKGRYVWFLNAGDAFAHSGTLAFIAEEIDSAPVAPDFIHGAAREAEGQDWPPFAPHHICTRMIGSHQAMLYRRAAIPLPFDEQLRVAGDYGFTRAFLAGSSITLTVGDVLVHCEKRGRSRQEALRGRIEEWSIRQSYDGPLMASLIFIRQSIADGVAQMAPDFHAWLRAAFARWTIRP